MRKAMRKRFQTMRIMPGDLRALAATSQLEAWRPYRYRDPARCSPARLAELEAHDEHVRRLEYLLAYPYRKRKGRA